MGRHCSAFGCTNNDEKNKPLGLKLTFHGFPLKSVDLLREWEQAVKRKTFTPTANSWLCSEHFTEEDFVYQPFTGCSHPTCGRTLLSSCPGMAKHAGDILTFLTLAKRGESSRKLRGILEHASVEEVRSWRDDDGLDVMHHVILGNNSEAVEYLLHHGYFARPHQPEINPYSHLAVLLGERTLLQILLQYRPDDYHPISIPFQLPEAVVEKVNKNLKAKTDAILKFTQLHSTNSTSSTSPSSCGSKRQYQIESIASFLKNVKLYSHLKISPLDVAARTGQVDCVSVILNQCVLQRNADSEEISANKSDLTLACLADSPQSVAVLLHTRAPSTTEFEAGVTVCLHHAYAECLDLLLQLGRDTKHMFKGMNFFHVLYTYSSDHGMNSYPRLTEVTEVLVKHGHDVNSKTPCRTYPAYSLLTHAFCFHDYGNTRYYVKALRLLINKGADPCFDEVKFEKRHPKQAARKIRGRAAFSSALHCLLETVEMYSQYLESPALAISFVEECAVVLMSGNSNSSMNQVGNVGDSDKMTIQGSVLHQLAKSSVNLGVNPTMVRCVLRHGADPNLKVDGKYAINIYFDKLFEKMTSLKLVDVKEKHMPDAMTMCRLCTFMTPAAVRECLAIFTRDHSKELSVQVRPYASRVLEELQVRSRQVRPLRDVSAWAVWTACNCRHDKVLQLPVSSEMKTYILPTAF